jgi:hypothetical protein
VRDHDVQGTLDARITGALPVRDYKAGTLQIGVTLTGANVSFGQFRIPMDRMVLAASTENYRFDLKSLHVEALRRRRRIAAARSRWTRRAGTRSCTLVVATCGWTTRSAPARPRPQRRSTADASTPSPTRSSRSAT